MQTAIGQAVPLPKSQVSTQLGPGTALEGMNLIFSIKMQNNE